MLRSLTQKLVSKPVSKNALNTKLVGANPVSFAPQKRFHSNIAKQDENDEFNYRDYPMYENEGGYGDEFNDEFYPEWLRNFQDYGEEFYTDQQTAINPPTKQ